MLPALAATTSRSSNADELALLEESHVSSPPAPSPLVVAAQMPVLPGPPAPPGMQPLPDPSATPPGSKVIISPAAAAEDRLDISPVWRIVVPALDIDARVVSVPLEEGTWNVGGIGEQIAWLGSTSTPGLAGNTALAGHVTLRKGGHGPFYFLHRLSQGDRVLVYTERNVYVYRVREQAVVKEDDVGVVAPTNNAQLTLLTCANWDEDTLAYIQRRAVFADLVQIKPLGEEE